MHFNVSIATSFYSMHSWMCIIILTKVKTSKKPFNNFKETIAEVDLRVGIVDVKPRRDIPDTTSFFKEIVVNITKLIIREALKL